MAAPVFSQADDGGIVLAFAECGRCGHRSFPAQDYGCPACGSAELREARYPAEGRVLCAVTVHKHRTPGIEGPYRIADVEIAGCVLRGIVDAPEDRDLVGASVGAVMADPSGPLPPIRFVKIAEVR